MIINYVLILTTLLLMSGLALDVGLLEWRRLRLQLAADATAQEAMYQLARGDTNWATEGQNEAIANGYTDGANTVTVTLSNPPASGTYAGNTFAVQANISQSVNNLFMEFVNGSKSTLAVSAVAVEIPTCVWITNTTGNSGGGNLQLASAGMYPNCGVYASTTSNYALCSDGFSTLRSMRTRVVGIAATTNACGGTITPQPIYGAATKNDPLHYLIQPTTFPGCSYPANTTFTGSSTLSPGYFCGPTTMSNATITLTPGFYTFADGLSISNSTIYGTAGVNFYFTKHSGSSYTSTTINGSTLYMKAPTNTMYNSTPGVLFWVDRNWVSHTTASLQMVDSSITADGVWYLLNTGLYLWSTPVNTYKYDVWVVDHVYQFGASSNFSIDYSPLGGVSPLAYEDGVLAQ